MLGYNQSMQPETKEKTVEKHNKNPSKLRRFLYGMSWSIIWPLIVAVPAFIVMLVILSQVLTSSLQNKDFTNAVNTDGIFYLELYFFIFVAILVVVLLLVKWLLRTRKHLFFRTGARVLGVYIWMGIFVTGLTMAFITKNPDAIKPPVARDNHLLAVVQQVGGKTDLIENVSIRYTDTFEGNFAHDRTRGTYIPISDSDGRFSYGIINVKTGLDTQTEKGVIAHEYLHHIWEAQLDDTTLHDLTSQLMTMYGRDEWMQNRTNFYSDTNYLLPTELFAFYCTEVGDAHLSSYVLATCNTYVNRSTLTFTRP